MPENAQNRYFTRLAPYIQDFIYRKRWDELREIQVEACRTILDTDHHLLLCSGTASGKTEAAFLPALTKLWENPSASVGILYVSPLKALINDQFSRIEELLLESGIPVTKWHGDVSQSVKTKLVRNPQGVMQTTPESLQALLMRNRMGVIKLFSDLRFIVIDEVHYFMSDPRGTQLLCLIEQICRLTGCDPVRIGLSATMSDYSGAVKWLCSGTSRGCDVPQCRDGRRSIRLSMQHFLIKPKNNKKDFEYSVNLYFDALFRATYGKRCLMFSNSKAAVEQNIAQLKRIAKKVGAPDVYHVHHGSISASLREHAEYLMKHEAGPLVTGATVTLELGIDIGTLERIVQTGSPFSVSSFVQRMGRTGRQTGNSEMFFLFAEEEKTFEYEFYKAIYWDMVKCIALIQLYLEERWVEPIPKNDKPYGILYHQTMAYLYAQGVATAQELAAEILTLSPFANITKQEYGKLLSFMVEDDQLELGENKELMVGEEGQRDTGNFQFFAVFEAELEFSVKYESQEIGTLERLYPVGQRFALAGKTWQVLEIDRQTHDIYVKPVEVLSTNTWETPIDIPLHTKIVRRMREVLREDTDYRYLADSATERLAEMRRVARAADCFDRLIVPLAPDVYGVFPWLGTGALLALSYALKSFGVNNELYRSFELPIFLLIDPSVGLETLQDALYRCAFDELDAFSFPVEENACMLGKFNDHVPTELLRQQYIEDVLDVADMQTHLKEFFAAPEA